MFTVSVPLRGIPAVYGDYAAWNGTRGLPAPAHVYIANVRNFHPHVLETSARGDEFNMVQLSAHWMVWVEYSPAHFTWTLHARNRQSGQRVVIDSSTREGVPPNPMLLPLLSLHGDTLAWSRITCHGSCGTAWSSSIVLTHLPDGHEHVLRKSGSPCSQTLPSLSTTLAVWDQEGTCGGITGTDVIMYDLTSSRLSAVTTNHLSSEATTNGTYIAWKQVKATQQKVSRLTDGDIVLLERRTGQKTIVSNRHMCQDPQSGSSSCATIPTLTNSLLAWQALDGDTVEALDLSSRRHYTLARPIEGKLYHTVPGLMGRGSGKRLIWTPFKLNQQTSQGIQYLAIGDVP